ncbi:hypothetical protein AB0A99_03920 [Streptomyces fradiae]|uniref:hypothetical protein n=1 Tax=Streptomyces fradiae TaxID=1906 RepID=UPI0033DD7B59
MPFPLSADHGAGCWCRSCSRLKARRRDLACGFPRFPWLCIAVTRRAAEWVGLTAAIKGGGVP